MPFLKRSAHVSLMHHAALGGMESRVSHDAGFEKIEKYHDTLIYPALIQAGVHRFKVSGIPHKGISGNKFIASRVDYIDRLEYYDSLERFKALLSDFLINDADKGAQMKIFALASFLVEITTAMRLGASVVSVLPIPKMEDYYGVLSLDVLLPIHGMISKISSVDVLSPIPQSKIIRDDVSELLEVMDGVHFGRYSKAHEVVEYEGGSAQAFQDVTGKALALKDKFSSTLDVKKVAISILPASSAVVDMVSGGSGIAGKLLSLISEPLSKYLGDKKSIVIYDYATLHEQILRGHYAALKEARDKLGE